MPTQLITFPSELTVPTGGAAGGVLQPVGEQWTYAGNKQAFRFGVLASGAAALLAASQSSAETGNTGGAETDPLVARYRLPAETSSAGNYILIAQNHHSLEAKMEQMAAATAAALAEISAKLSVLNARVDNAELRQVSWTAAGGRTTEVDARVVRALLTDDASADDLVEVLELVSSGVQVTGVNLLQLATDGLSSADGAVRSAAGMALARISGVDAIPRLEAARGRERNRYVREAFNCAIESLTA